MPLTFIFVAPALTTAVVVTPFTLPIGEAEMIAVRTGNTFSLGLSSGMDLIRDFVQGDGTGSC